MSLNIPVNIIFIFLLLIVLIERSIECYLDIKDLFIEKMDVDKSNEKSRRVATFFIGCLCGVIICSILRIDIFELVDFRLRGEAYFLTGLIFGTSIQIMHIMISVCSYFIKKMKKELAK